MKKYNLFHLGMAGLLVMATLSSCENDELEISPFAQIYMPQAIDKPSQHTLVMTDSAQALVFGAAYGSPDVLGKDMDIQFELAPEMVAGFNQENGTDYELMPEGSYELSGDQAFITAGEMQSESLKLWVNPGKGFDFETKYLLPVTIKSVQSDLPVNEALRTTYFLVDANPPVYEAFDRSQWNVYDVSSEEVSGEGENNGHAKHALDGDIETFWHTQWQGASPGLPHIITVDMGESKLVNGFSFIQRQNRGTGNVNELFIELSEDGENWTQVEIFPGNLPNDNNNNPVFLTSSSNARYFRVTITSTYGNTNFTHLAEIYGF
ncbi:discoidin domain-containing protein [Echinicola sp. CAU 1574]|uniref:Discoidin domain-containing protein n=1 Tax=Echinicola arenosa TaxID=2774144 RepID=A0ABR9AJN0_9BACT|nr:discoidin domain-containing protein [Echinicola arenosa]MBD8487819.1 discoidin domain-containing protein [Echinicola arenosa]